MISALKKSGFTFVEIISPCPINYGRRNRMPTGLIEMQYYQDKSVIRHFTDPKDAAIVPEGELVVGTFVDQDTVDYFEVYEEYVKEHAK